MRIVNVALVWLLQVALAFVFLAHGWMFLFPSPEIAALMNASLPRWFTLFLGVAEIAAGIGVTLPALTRIQPWLVRWAAFGMALVVGAATVWHAVRGEWTSAATTLVLFGLAMLLARVRRGPVSYGVRAVPIQ